VGSHDLDGLVIYVELNKQGPFPRQGINAVAVLEYNRFGALDRVAAKDPDAAIGLEGKKALVRRSGVVGIIRFEELPYSFSCLAVKSLLKDDDIVVAASKDFSD